MTAARSLAFNLAFGLVTLAMGFIGLPLLLGRRTWVHAYGRIWARACMMLLKITVGLDWEVRGRPPTDAVLIAAKHQSAWETLALILVVRNPAFVMKKALLWTPPFGPYLWKAGMIAIDRGSGAKAIRAMQTAAADVIAEGRPIVVFPEGTRRAPGAPPDYKSGVAALYRGIGRPTAPVALNSGQFWGRNAFAKRPGRIVLAFLEPIPPGLERRTFMRRLEDEIETASTALAEEAEQARRIVP